jgi:hypothetical protein
MDWNVPVPMPMEPGGVPQLPNGQMMPGVPLAMGGYLPPGYCLAPSTPMPPQYYMMPAPSNAPPAPTFPYAPSVLGAGQRPIFPVQAYPPVLPPPDLSRFAPPQPYPRPLQPLAPRKEEKPPMQQSVSDNVVRVLPGDDDDEDVSGGGGISRHVSFHQHPL